MTSIHYTLRNLIEGKHNRNFANFKKTSDIAVHSLPLAEHFDENFRDFFACEFVWVHVSNESQSKMIEFHSGTTKKMFVSLKS